MNKDDLSEPRKDEIRFAGKGGNMRSKSIAKRTGYFSHKQFGFRVLAVNERHPLTALNSRERIHRPRPAYRTQTSFEQAHKPIKLWKTYTSATQSASEIFAFSSPRLRPASKPILPLAKLAHDLHLKESPDRCPTQRSMLVCWWDRHVASAVGAGL
jgi:hypothetical protein